MASHGVTLLPRTSRSVYNNRRIERSHGFFKLIVERTELDDKKESLRIVVALASFLNNCMTG